MATAEQPDGDSSDEVTRADLIRRKLDDRIDPKRYDVETAVVHVEDKGDHVYVELACNLTWQELKELEKDYSIHEIGGTTVDGFTHGKAVTMLQLGPRARP